jgi:multiple sugar transport system ATP-binding protein
MGRALVREPQVFLMDEPLSNLDAKLRTQMRAEIAGLQREIGVTTMYVTHDQVEAMTMGTRIAVMRDGLLQQQGPPQQLYDEPGNLFVAAFVGSPAMNLLQGVVVHDDAGTAVVVGNQRLPLGGNGAGPLTAYTGTEVAVGLRPEHLADPGAAPPGRPRLRGLVKFVERLGPERLVQLELDAKPVVADELLELARHTDATAATEILRESQRGQALVTARFEAHAAVEPGDRAEVAVAAERLHFFDLTTGAAIR